MKKRTLTALVLAVMLVLGVTACNAGYELAGENNDDGTLTYTAKNCKADGMTMINYTVEEGVTKVVFHSNLEQGTLHVDLSPAIDLGDPTTKDEDATVAELEESAGVTLDDLTVNGTIIAYDASGTKEETLEITPGSYALKVFGDDANPATGTLTITFE